MKVALQQLHFGVMAFYKQVKESFPVKTSHKQIEKFPKQFGEPTLVLPQLQMGILHVIFESVTTKIKSDLFV